MSSRSSRRRLLASGVLADINTDALSNGLEPIAAIGERLICQPASAGASGVGLWATDGTAAGTKLIKDIRVGESGSDPAELTAFKGRLYFSADDGVHGREIWQSDGTAAGTRLASDTYAGATSARPGNLVVFGNRLIFSADSDTVGRAVNPR